MAVYYQIRSPLSQVTDDYMDGYIAAVSAAVGEEFTKVSLENYLAEDFALLYVASGGSEGMISMDQSILKLFRAGKISRETALDYADNPDQMRRRVDAQ